MSEQPPFKRGDVVSCYSPDVPERGGVLAVLLSTDATTGKWWGRIISGQGCTGHRVGGFPCPHCELVGHIELPDEDGAAV